MEFRGIVKTRDRNTKIMYIAVVCVLIVMEILQHQLFYIPIAFLVLLACFLEKEQIINEKGITTRLRGLTLVNENTWRWEDINSLGFNYKEKAPNVLLHIRWDVKMRSYVIHSYDSDGIKKLAKKMNPNIVIESFN